jgi:hypothetical protein
LEKIMSDTNKDGNSGFFHHDQDFGAALDDGVVTHAPYGVSQSSVLLENTVPQSTDGASIRSRVISLDTWNSEEDEEDDDDDNTTNNNHHHLRNDAKSILGIVEHQNDQRRAGTSTAATRTATKASPRFQWARLVHWRALWRRRQRREDSSSVQPKYEPVAGPSWTKDDNAPSAAHDSGVSL